jgi:cellulose biosynthesis protein BcsQ
VTGPPSQPHPLRVVTVASNKGGVGKTTVATNLAVYFRALREDLPVLVVGLDDQTVVDRMFQLERLGSDDANLKHCWAERSLDRAIRLGQYGVHYVPSPPDTAPLKSRADDPETLARILVRTKWDGVVILDTKSDLEGLTRNALFAADRVIVPVADRSSLDEADKVFALLDHLRRGRERARVLLTLVDARTHLEPHGGLDLGTLLEREVERRGWPRYRAHLSRSPRAEALASAGGAPLSLLHHARGTTVHRQMRELAEEVLAELGLDPAAAGVAPATPPDRLAPVRPLDWKSALLRGFRGR